MAELRAAGASREELALIHEMKALLHARMVDWMEPQDPANCEPRESVNTPEPAPQTQEAPQRRRRHGAQVAGQGSIFGG